MHGRNKDFPQLYSIARERERWKEKFLLEGSEDICKKGVAFHSTQ